MGQGFFLSNEYENTGSPVAVLHKYILVVIFIATQLIRWYYFTMVGARGRGLSLREPICG